MIDVKLISITQTFKVFLQRVSKNFVLCMLLKYLTQKFNRNWVFGLSGPWPTKNFQPPQLPTTQSPVTMIMWKLLSMVYGLFKPCWLTHPTHTSFKETALLSNVHLNSKLTMEKIRFTCWMCSKLKLNPTWHCSDVFIVDFDQSQYINIVFLLLTLNKHLSVGCERQVIVFWKHKKRHICFVIKVHGLFHSWIYHCTELK